MKVLNNIEIIIIGNGVYYNYNGTLYTKEQFEDTYFPKVDASSKPQEPMEYVCIPVNIERKEVKND